jgi:GLPGLI family protein
LQQNKKRKQMKKFILIAGCITMCLQQPVIVNAQMAISVIDPNETMKAEPIDEVQFTAQYETQMVTDTLNPEKLREESMILKVGSRSSAYYSYTYYVTDSIIREQLRKSGNVNINRQNSGNSGFITYRIYKNHPAGKVTTLDKIGMNRFRCEEENEIPAWQLLPDTMTLLSYPCQKARCRFKGRDYEAWFTPEIPRSEGPWKLHGLPGLILKASDSQGHYTFECTGLIHAAEDLLFGAEGYESISRKNLNRIYERYYVDPVGYITSSSPNVKITIKGEDGESKTIKNMPYNPIERSEK